MQVTDAYAKAHFSELLKAVESGEVVEIVRCNKLVANLVPAPSTTNSPKLGTAPPSVRILDPNWAKPLSKKQMRDLLGKRSPHQ